MREREWCRCTYCKNKYEGPNGVVETLKAGTWFIYTEAMYLGLRDTVFATGLQTGGSKYKKPKSEGTQL